MQPELVLSQEEKEERFKRYFERKRDDRGAQVPIESKGGDGEESGSTGNKKEEDEGAAFEEAISGAKFSSAAAAAAAAAAASDWRNRLLSGIAAADL